MGRRLAGGALVAIGLIVASIAWAGFSLTRTVLDPTRSTAIAEDVYEDPVVRRQLESSIASAVDAALPDELGVPRRDIAEAAERALDDPAVADLLVGGLVRAHQRLLGEDAEPDEPIAIDAGAFAAATRRELVSGNPELVGRVPEMPPVSIPLPTDSIPDVSGLRDRIVAGVALLAAVAVGFVAAAFIVTDNRARILRRVGFWAIGAAAFWLVIGVALPWLAHLLLPDQAAVIGAFWGVAAHGMLDPSITAATAGAGALALSLVWSLGSRLAAARARRPGPPDPRRQRIRPADPQAGVSQPPAVPSQPPGVPSQPPAVPRPPVSRPPAAPVPGRAAGDGTRVAPQPTRPGGTAEDPTRVGAPASSPSGGAPGAANVPPAGPARPAPRWIEGVGYVDDGDSSGRY